MRAAPGETMKQPLCYTCKERPAGNSIAGSYSAYCEECQPRNTEQQLKGFNESRCPSCREVFASLTDFDSHRELDQNLPGYMRHCVDPASVGLELRNNVWGTPEGNVTRDRKTMQL